MSPRAAGRILREQGMPPDEVHAVLAGRDPVLARRVLALHRERLGEWLDEQRRLIERIERSWGGRAPAGRGGTRPSASCP